MRAIFIGAVLSLVLCVEGKAQSFFPTLFSSFSEAAVVLTTGTILTGSLELYHKAEVISITCANDSVYTMGAQLVQGFAVKDASITKQRARDTHVALNRVFRTFPLPNDKNSRRITLGFYEQLNQGPGPLLLLRRELRTQANFVIMPRNPALVGSEPIPMLTYPNSSKKTIIYLRTATGAILSLRKPKHILKHLPQQAQLLRAYARQNELHYDNMRELSFLVNYANTLLVRP